MKVRFAVSPGGNVFDAGEFVSFVATLERKGFDGMWLSDVPLGHTIDPIVGLSYAAAMTTKLKLGANVVPIGRSPITLAKELAQADRLSGGRVLLTFVPGVDEPGERAGLGIGSGDRPGALDEAIVVCRKFWSGEPVEHVSERYSYSGQRMLPTPLQVPLEVWLGGKGPAALRRAGRLSDGWLGAGVAPRDCVGACARINEAAAAAGRSIDPEHFGMSIPYARSNPSDGTIARILERSPGNVISDLLPVGPEQLRDLVGRYLESGVSKFVVRSVGQIDDWDDELSHLAEIVLPLQS
jgi:probable F420-dependent oxidoreductase